MTSKEILDSLDELGFQVEEFAEHTYRFDFENLSVLYFEDVDDSDFFRFSLYGVHEIEDAEQRPIILDVLNEVNTSIKYVKAFLVEDVAWLSYEQSLSNNPTSAEETISTALSVLYAAFNRFNKIMEANNED